uniref:Glucose receptor Git3 N-terminal domain-containing protein n=1 Tax=Kwoniella bestiolae CBS 10118 TaxID=1296100 RepID=A0A1B9GC28_9TREE|nr:hypothetical protein I302_00051 [Kwoniella bestiolae CBS 10118]OCF28563.1 hypothetical protein I302_00051 [Kwoniella bestiolae CBS 10118]
MCIVISLSSIPLLLLSIIPHLLPSHLSGISPTARLSPPTISLVIWTILKCSSTILDRYVLKKAQDLTCSVDAIVIAALTTGTVAHIPAIALYRYRSLPTPSTPSPTPPTNLRNTICLAIIYAYSLLPCVPTLSKAISRGFTSSKGLSKWWGYYCIADGDWFRTIRPLTLLAPLVMTLPFTVLIFSVLYSTSGHPSPHIHPTARHWAQATFLLIGPLAIGGYVILEQIVGWNDTWLLRGLEATAGPILALSLLFNLQTWSTYSHWVRLRGPPPPPDHSNPSTPLLLGSNSLSKRSSSFYVDKLEDIPGLVPKRSVRFPPTPQQVEYIPDRTSPGLFNRRAKMESLLPPPAKRKSGLLKSALINSRSPHIVAAEEEGQRMEVETELDLERGLHPHPHSINENFSPPTDLSPTHEATQMIKQVPQLIIKQPTPIHLDRSRYSSSTNASSPFQYQDLVTFYSITPSEGRGRNSVWPNSVYSSTTLPYDGRAPPTLGGFTRGSSTSSSNGSGKPLSEMVGGIGHQAPVPPVPSNTRSISEGDPVYPFPQSAKPKPRPVVVRSTSEKEQAHSETSSIYSQPSIVEPHYPASHRPSMMYGRSTSSFGKSSEKTMAPTPEMQEEEEEEMIKFG